MSESESTPACGGSDAGANIWYCYCGYRLHADAAPDCECERCGRDGEWTEAVVAERYPREGHAGAIICGQCSNRFVGYHGPKTGGWYCPDCSRHINPRTEPVRVSPSSGETGDQAEIGAWSQ